MSKNKKKTIPAYSRRKADKLLHPNLFNYSASDCTHKKILCDIILFDEQGNKLTFNKVALDNTQIKMPKRLKYLM